MRLIRNCVLSESLSVSRFSFHDDRIFQRPPTAAGNLAQGAASAGPSNALTIAKPLEASPYTKGRPYGSLKSGFGTIPGTSGFGKKWPTSRPLVEKCFSRPLVDGG
jgi:hypothetical protein